MTSRGETTVRETIPATAPARRNLVVSAWDHHVENEELSVSLNSCVTCAKPTKVKDWRDEAADSEEEAAAATEELDPPRGMRHSMPFEPGRLRLARQEFLDSWGGVRVTALRTGGKAPASEPTLLVRANSEHKATAKRLRGVKGIMIVSYVCIDENEYIQKDKLRRFQVV